ncbi:MAG: 2-oxoacid:acceptor oxidoreductase family protein [Saprospiraceae bacterium]
MVTGSTLTNSLISQFTNSPSHIARNGKSYGYLNRSPANKRKKVLPRHIVEIVSDSGEGAQKAGQSFASISAKMGNGVWTVEIIPSDIEPPPRTLQSTSGIRIRIGSEEVTNAGDEADLVVAFNEWWPYSRIEQHAFKPGTIILIENAWAQHDDPSIRESYAKAIADFKRWSTWCMKSQWPRRLKIRSRPQTGQKHVGTWHALATSTCGN